MKSWIQKYLESQKSTLDKVPADQVDKLIALVHNAHQQKRNIFVFANGGSASSLSHFTNDMTKGASDAIQGRFKIISLSDNSAVMTALANDYSYEDVFVRQLMVLAEPGDIALTASVSGSSPNLVKAMTWAKEHQLHTVALVGGKRGKLADIVDQCIVIDDTHYGRVEDVHMTIAHMLAYAFIEHADQFRA